MNFSDRLRQRLVEKVRALKAKDWIAAFLLLCIGFIGALVIWHTTPFGSGLRADSFAYMTAAEGLLEGVGYGRVAVDGTFKPLTGFPPLYSTTIASVMFLGLGLHQAVRLIGGATFAGIIILSGLSTQTATKSWGSSLFVSLMVLWSPSLIELHSWALSEGVYFLLVLLTIWMWTLYFSNASAVYYVAGLVGLALTCLTRFAGVALVGAVSVHLLLNSSERLTLRVREAATSLLVGLSPLGLFFLRNWGLWGDLANRPAPSWHPPGMTILDQTGRVILSWIGFSQPTALPTTFKVLAILLLLSALLIPVILSWFWFYRTNRTLNSSTGKSLHSFAFLVSLFGLLSLSIVFVSMTFLDPMVLRAFASVGERLLSPTYLSILLLLGLLVHSVSERVEQRGRLILTLACAVALLGQASLGMGRMTSLHNEGLGMNDALGIVSPTIDYVRGLPDVPIYSNNIQALYLMAGRITRFIPFSYDPAQGRAVSNYDHQLDQMTSRLCESGGFLVLFGGSIRDSFDADHFDDLTRNLTLVEEFRDGLVYQGADKCE